MNEIKFTLLVPRAEAKADCLVILPLPYELVFHMASLMTFVLPVPIASVILGDCGNCIDMFGYNSLLCRACDGRTPQQYFYAAYVHV